jgi:hypothetical protein
MSIRFNLAVKFNLLAGVLLIACSPTRQIAVDFPSVASGDDESVQTTKVQQFQPIPGFLFIDGDDYYLRLISEFEFKGDNILKGGCNNMAPSYEKNDLSSALLFTVRNDLLKLNSDAVGFSYQATTGKCNFKFDAKKLILTPWMRLDTGKETTIDYSYISSANSDVDVAGLLGDVTTASSLLSFTGLGMGVAIAGQYAGQLVKNNQQSVQSTPTITTTPINPSPTITPPPNVNSAKKSSESHTLPATVSYSGKTGVLNQTIFKVYAVEEGGINLLGSNTQPLGELKIYPEISSSLLLKTGADGVPDARDLTFDEISYAPIKSASGEIKLLQLIEQSKHPAKPNLIPKWANYAEVESNCRKIKLVMKDLGFNKFDRNVFIYYYLSNSGDWLNYNISRQKVSAGEFSSKVLADYRHKDFGSCLNADDYMIMKTMGLAVNTPAEWEQMGETSQKKEQSFTPLKSIERQLLSVLKNASVTEMEHQLYPLLATAKSGAGTVLLQNNLGDFGLEAMLNPSVTPAPKTPMPSASPTPSASSSPSPNATPTSTVNTAKETPPPTEQPAPTAMPAISIPGEGLIISARQLAHVFAGLLIDEHSCARPAPQQQGNQPGNEGILLFTTKTGSPRAKGGAMEFEFSAGKINRIAFQLPTYRDFEQDLLDRPEIGGCRIDPAWVAKLH